jgi:hypothetical protein
MNPSSAPETPFPSPSGEPGTPATAPARQGLVSGLWMLGLSVAYLALNIWFLFHTVRDPKLVEKMQAKDSRQYVEIAQQFAAGDFTMSYVRDMPHRQPLYPLTLAPAVRGWGQEPAALGAVNIVVGLILLLWLYRGLLGLFDSQTIAVLTTLAFIVNPFMVDKISCRLMTEPLHALCLVVLIIYFLAYLQKGRTRDLLAASAAAGVDYLARTNGLFVMAAMGGTLFCVEVWRLFRKNPPVTTGQPEPKKLGTRLLGYVAAVLVFLAAATPSWLPRYVYFKQPFFHGYLSNFMWVDNYDEAHTGQAKTDFTWKDYAAGHDWHGFATRWIHGFYRVYYDIPKHTEHYRVLYFFAVAGLILALVLRRAEYCFLALFLFIQLLPVVWTVIANPGPRISYGTMFPFELFFAALTLSYAIPQITRQLTTFRSRRAAGG